MRFAWFSLAVFLILSSVPSLALGHEPNPEMNPAKLVQFTLISSEASPVAGKAFTLAIKAKIAPGWHIYWVNPGDSGMATAISVKAPAGWKAGDVRFPIPHKFDQPGGFVGYGYMDEAVFLVDLTPGERGTREQSAGEKMGDQKVTVGATYLVCEKVCLPGKAQVSISFPIGGVAAGENVARIDAWKKAEPVKAGALDAPDKQSIQTTGKISDQWSTFLVTYSPEQKAAALPGENVTGIELFPEVDDSTELKELHAESVGSSGTKILFQAKLLAGETVAATRPGGTRVTMRFLAVYTPANGNRYAVWLPVLLK